MQLNFKILSVVSLAVVLVQPVTACLQAHAYMSNCVFAGDCLSVQVWDNGNKACDVTKCQNLASQDTVYSFDCGNNYKLDVTGNAANAVITNTAGTFQLENIDTHHSSFVCGNFGDAAEIHGTEFETVFSDHSGCAGFDDPVLCDFGTFC
ncbi:hypothetical protein DL96DRAFT_1217142 [Flagelloscypha sp. PMI_526]|nr:hypothetical protein DL96DRAFT_1217142 [Flagelloscypha sp. PMI_526]